MSEPTFHQIETKKTFPMGALITFVSVIIVGGLGIISGYLAVNYFPQKGGQLKGEKTANNSTVAQIAGQKNLKLFPDTAEGVLKKGGIDGEGTHHLVRKGGKDQYAYLTSSSIDLQKYVGKKVKIWGKTYAAQTAGWLMDVGYLEVM